MKFLKYFIGFLLVLILTSHVYAGGSANLTIIHEESDFLLVEYVFRYGPVEQEDPMNYPYEKRMVPDGGPTKVKSKTRVSVEGDAPFYFFSVKDIYKIDENTYQETEFSESSFPIHIPGDVLGVQVK